MNKGVDGAVERLTRGVPARRIPPRDVGQRRCLAIRIDIAKFPADVQSPPPPIVEFGKVADDAVDAVGPAGFILQRLPIAPSPAGEARAIEELVHLANAIEQA